jgi:hypothetical protein
MKKCSPQLVIKETLIKSMLKFHLTPIRVNIIKNTNDEKCWQGCGGKGALMHCWGCKLVQPLWKTVWRLLRKIKIDLTYDPGILLPAIYLKERESGYNKSICIPMFIATLFTLAKL